MDKEFDTFIEIASSKKPPKLDRNTAEISDKISQGILNELSNRYIADALTDLSHFLISYVALQIEIIDHLKLIGNQRQIIFKLLEL